ncbi:MAG: hypothetical protein IJN04_05725 [Clostridia bacterium]|nr:hypothetical protein [Clostridia bacterium]
MALQERHKNKLRQWIRVAMVFIAVVLLLFSVVIPVVNNAIALGVENDLKSIPLPAKTELVESTSKAGKMVGNGNGMQYFGAILIKSDLSLEKLDAYYQTYRMGSFDCLIAGQLSNEILAVEHGDLAFRHNEYGVGYYIVYTWGSAPHWLRDWLDTDLRGH